MRHFSGIAVAVSIFLLTFVSTDRALARNGELLTPVTVQLKWKHQFQFAGYYMAIKRGYYADIGLHVKLRESFIGQDPMNEVIEGRADYGVGNTDLLLMRNKGHSVVILANIFQHSPLALMTPKSSGITNVHQLASKKLMIEPHSTEIFAYFAKEGVKLDGLKLIPHTFNTINLLSGRVSSMSVYNTDEPFLMEQAGIDFQLLRPIESGIDFYGDNLFTMEKTINENPEQVEAFTKATNKGWDYALSHIDETIDYMLDTYVIIRSREHLLFEAERTKALIMSDIVPVGYTNPLRWQLITDIYKGIGFLPADFSSDDMIYNPEKDFIPLWLMQALAIASSIALITFLIAAYVIRLNRKLVISEVQLTQANLHKETLLSIIGHDVKDNIFAVRRYGELMISTPSSVDQETTINYGQRVLFGVDAAIDILDNLLQWAMLQQASARGSIELINLQPIIQKNIDLLTPYAKANNITITSNVTSEIAAMCNIWRVDTVIRNLLNNARKFTSPGDCIHINAENIDGMFRLIIEDTGKGMPEKDIAVAFETELKSNKDKQGKVRSGFGLPLCRKLLQANGGSIILENRPEGGLRATITLSNKD